MAQPSTLYRFTIEISNVDRNQYETIEFRVAQHPSESGAYLLSRVLAFVLNFQEGLEFSPQGLGDPETPAIRQSLFNDTINLWIEIGSPNPKKLHKATKTAKLVKVYTYKDPKVLIGELKAQYVHKLETIEIFSIPNKFLEKTELHLARDNKWSIMVMDSIVTINGPGFSESGELTRHKLEN